MRTHAPEQIFCRWLGRQPWLLVRSDVPLTVSRAIAWAGGAKSGAHMEAVLVLRRTPDGVVHYYQVALGHYAGAGIAGEDPLLQHL